MKWLLYRSKPMSERDLLSKALHKCLVTLLWPFYRRLPECLHAHGPIRAYCLLCDNYRHLSEVELPSARKIEGMALREAMNERQQRINAEARLLGVDEGTMKHINSVFGTNLPTTRMDD